MADGKCCIKFEFVSASQCERLINRFYQGTANGTRGRLRLCDAGLGFCLESSSVASAGFLRFFFWPWRIAERFRNGGRDPVLSWKFSVRCHCGIDGQKWCLNPSFRLLLGTGSAQKRLERKVISLLRQKVFFSCALSRNWNAKQALDKCAKAPVSWYLCYPRKQLYQRSGFHHFPPEILVWITVVLGCHVTQTQQPSRFHCSQHNARKL